MFASHHIESSSLHWNLRACALLSFSETFAAAAASSSFSFSSSSSVCYSFFSQYRLFWQFQPAASFTPCSFSAFTSLHVLLPSQFSFRWKKARIFRISGAIRIKHDNQIGSNLGELPPFSSLCKLQFTVPGRQVHAFFLTLFTGIATLAEEVVAVFSRRQFGNLVGIWWEFGLQN